MPWLVGGAVLAALTLLAWIGGGHGTPPAETVAQGAADHSPTATLHGASPVASSPTPPSASPTPRPASPTPASTPTSAVRPSPTDLPRSTPSGNGPGLERWLTGAKGWGGVVTRVEVTRSVTVRTSLESDGTDQPEAERLCKDVSFYLYSRELGVPGVFTADIQAHDGKSLMAVGSQGSCGRVVYGPTSTPSPARTPYPNNEEAKLKEWLAQQGAWLVEAVVIQNGTVVLKTPVRPGDIDHGATYRSCEDAVRYVQEHRGSLPDVHRVEVYGGGGELVLHAPSIPAECTAPNRQPARAVTATAAVPSPTSLPAPPSPTPLRASATPSRAVPS